MTPLQPCRSLALFVCLLLAAPAWGAEDRPGQPPSSGVAEARSLISAGNFDEALAILRPLARGSRVESRVIFNIGLAAVGAAQQSDVAQERRDDLLDEAIAAFRAMLIRRPDLVRVRLELARAFFLKGEDRLATRHFEQVLADNPAGAAVLNVNRFLKLMRARKRWSLRLGVALAPDSNISAQTDEQTIELNTPYGRKQHEFHAADEPESGIGISVWASGEYQYPLGDPGTGSGARSWRLRAGADVSRREYRSDEFDRMTVGAHLGPRWLIDRASEASVLASARQSWLADKTDYRDLGIRVEGRHRLNRRTTASLNASRYERRYDVATYLDGPLTDISAGLGWVATQTVRIDTGLGWASQRTDRERQRHTRRWVRLGVTAHLPWGFTVGGAGTLTWTDYPADWGPFVLGGGPRRDLTRSIRLNAYNRAFILEGFSPQVSLVQEQRTSNAQLHGYRRISAELRFVRLF